ncbi:MAG: hypothetical protein ACT4PN_13525 [Nitrospiraceae bacterium]
MAIQEFVTAIQSLFPPQERIPAPEPGLSGRSEGLPSGVEPTPRPVIPEWLRPGNGVLVPADGTLVVEGDTLPVQNVQLPVIDALAYYLPFHFYTERWGIYVRSSGIVTVASMLASATGGKLSSDVVNLAYAILLHHERFHFFSEIACSRAELVLHDERYHHYFHDQGATACEEALANAYAFRTALRRQPAVIRQHVKQWMHEQGPAYRDFSRCLAPVAFADWCRTATKHMRNTGKNGIVLSLPGIACGDSALYANRVILQDTVTFRDGRKISLPTEFLYDGLTRSVAPIRVVLDVPGVVVLKPFPKDRGLRVLVHSHDHPPPHIHVDMPPGTPFTRLEWPTLDPLSDDPPLSKSGRRKLDEYLSKYRDKIERKIKEVYW